MKRWIAYVLIVAAALAAPVERLDVGKLEPVQAVWLSGQGERLVLETDTGDRGAGTNVAEALAQLEKGCAGIIYLDTAQFLLVAEDAADQIPQLAEYLKGSVRVGQWNGEGSLKKAAKYMAAHKTGCRLRDWKSGEKLPVLPG